MNKISHISLAAYLMKCEGFEGLQEHRKAFYLGSILPDCIPSFLTRKHRIDTTFQILKKELIRLTERRHLDKGMNGWYCRHLGVVTHYLADYFTYPHNSVFSGSLREHCSYENRMREALQEYMQSPAARLVREKNGIIHTVDEICTLVARLHAEYLRVRHEIQDDCRYIVELCHRILDAILQVLERNLAEISVVLYQTKKVA